ncbi:actin-like ATPase domain-containing protein [Athelia psychrophila]|uniref:Actin-like ATPase domain-containing protein n=1 Tax=Athelia psychrophila TaxID=1759441 RepID=A0A165YT38_9AGAM|nr:actin-like ATPase domain-containing protein [Fibularhizoctonia sp. CBS 109695]
MPRGIPNAKRDDTGMRYTTFTVPLPPNPKHTSTSYLKTDTQSLWARNATRKAKLAAESGATPEPRRGSNVIVIHPGSRWLRVGRAMDVNPTSVPNVIARKHKPPVPEPTFTERISRPRVRRLDPSSLATSTSEEDEYAVHALSDDPFDAKLASITVSLRDRMRFYKLRVTQNAAHIASTFNDQWKPELIQDYNDPYRVDWIRDDAEDVLVGEKVYRLADPHGLGYTVKWPIYGPKLNTVDYTSAQMALADVETIIRMTLEEKCNVNMKEYKDYSVILVIPDFYERAYIRDFTNLLLVTMGFKQICVQQESLAATYGAGISSACVVDIGAVSTSIACVDEGLVIADTRMTLSIGGDDITEFLYVLLDRICFPYRDLDLARSYDWNVMEDLKARLCTLGESDVALNLYDFVVRRPGEPAEKYGLRAYDEIILAPMCIFEPRVVEFDKKRIGFRPSCHPDVTEEIMEHSSDQVTTAMSISTQHLMPLLAAMTAAPVLDTPSASAPATPAIPQSAEAPPSKAPSPSPAGDSTPADVPMEAVGAEAESKVPASSPPAPSISAVQTDAFPTPTITSPSTSGLMIDVCFEASKLPLDVAIFNSARAAGGDDKIRKYLQAVLVIGGTALVPGIAHALESRLQAIATPLVPNMEKVQIIPPPKEVDQRVLAWKGAAVLGKMDGVSELWLTAADWDILGMRGLKERCFYL